MFLSLRRHLLICLAVCGTALLPVHAQDTAATQSITPPTKLDYPDSTGGLEKLAKDIMKAQKEGDSARADFLLQSMVLPDPVAWYSRVFGEYSARKDGAPYDAARKNVPAQLATFFLNAQHEHATEVVARRFEEKCDDNAGEATFGILQSRLEPVPLYELRLFMADRFFRLWVLAYVDGGFRFIAPPHATDYFPPSKRPAAAPADTSQAASNKPQEESTDKDDADPPTRVRQGGNVVAARIISKVQPAYPETARREHLQGTVRLHAIIRKDGSISHLKVTSGYCSLAQASLDAVKQWRYSPMMLLGQPVEVDTNIDVTFALNH
jgi:TonB family protein